MVARSTQSLAAMFRLDCCKVVFIQAMISWLPFLLRYSFKLKLKHLYKSARSNSKKEKMTSKIKGRFRLLVDYVKLKIASLYSSFLNDAADEIFFFLNPLGWLINIAIMKFLQDTTIGCCNFYCKFFVSVQTVLSIACYMFGLFKKKDR